MAFLTRSRRLPTGRRRLPALFLLAVQVLAAVSVARPANAETMAPEFAIKAAYLLKFAPFIEWPTSAFASAMSPFYVCVFGGDPFGPSLNQALDGHQVGEHPVMVRRLQAVDETTDCHILYLGAARAPQAEAVLNKVRGTPVLTVTEQGPAVTGQVVQFVVKNGHVRFTIDAGAAAVNRMAISAKLLSLAASLSAGS